MTSGQSEAQEQIMTTPTTRTLNIDHKLAKRLKLCVDTVNGYHHFHPGQDGHQGMKELTEFVYSLQPEEFTPPPKPELRLWDPKGKSQPFWGHVVGREVYGTGFAEGPWARDGLYELDPTTGKPLEKQA